MQGRDQWIVGSPAPVVTSISQLLYRQFRVHCGRRGRKVVKANTRLSTVKQFLLDTAAYTRPEQRQHQMRCLLTWKS